MQSYPSLAQKIRCTALVENDNVLAMRHGSPFVTSPSLPNARQTSTRHLLLPPVITTRCLYNPVSVQQSYFPHSQCSCTRTAKQTRQRPNIGYVNETRPRPTTEVHKKNGGDSVYSTYTNTVEIRAQNKELKIQALLIFYGRFWQKVVEIF